MTVIINVELSNVICRVSLRSQVVKFIGVVKAPPPPVGRNPEPSGARVKRLMRCGDRFCEVFPGVLLLNQSFVSRHRLALRNPARQLKPMESRRVTPAMKLGLTKSSGNLT